MEKSWNYTDQNYISPQLHIDLEISLVIPIEQIYVTL